MNKLYLITGATGHVGTVLLSALKSREAHVRALVLPGEGKLVPDLVEFCEGDVTRPDSLKTFFNTSGYDYTTLIHCAAHITVSSKSDPKVWDVNVNGTDHVMRAALYAGIRRVIYVSSVHAIPERPYPEIITEVDAFSPELVHGQYAKSKAAAAEKVLNYARLGLNVSIVHPSGIIGPGDLQGRNHMIRTIRAMAKGLIPVGMQGGYDFVDSRDVVSGILGCELHGKVGECYILSGHYLTVLELLNMVREIRGKRPVKGSVPYGLMKIAAPAAEWICRPFMRMPPLITPYSVYTLHTNGHFSCDKARAAFCYHPRDAYESVRASLTG